ncbi:hypothetical protein ACWGB8_35105 [Kitasatospora sp. NPDC054939]
MLTAQSDRSQSHTGVLAAGAAARGRGYPGRLPDRRLLQVVELGDDRGTQVAVVLDNSLTVTALPELRQAQRDHQRLIRHPDAANATIWAKAITTRWYDQQSVLATRWQHRLR